MFDCRLYVVQIWPQRFLLCSDNFSFCRIIKRVLANSVEFTGGGVGLFLTYAPGLSNLQFETPVGFYYFALALMFISIVIVYWLEASRFGAQLVAILENEDAAEALGIDTF